MKRPKQYPMNGPKRALQLALIQGRPNAARAYDKVMEKVRSDLLPQEKGASK